MSAIFEVSEIISTPSKVAILRVFVSRTGLRASGREIARRAGYSVPSTHESLKDLHNRGIVSLEIIGKQHIYSLNEKDRIVQKIIRPMFEAEKGIKKDIGDFVISEVRRGKIKQKIVSLILYGSVERGVAHKDSDVDIAVVVSKKADIGQIEELFNSRIISEFKEYFGVQLDPYIKTAPEFRTLLRNKKPPVATLMKAYSVLYGKEPLEI